MKLSMSERFLALLPFHAICLFAGVRPTECKRLRGFMAATASER